MKKDRAKIIEKEKIAEGIISILLQTELAKEAVPGQFIMINTHSEAHLLGRPISICDIDSEKSVLRIVFRIVGYGTDELSRAETGSEYEILGPLGNGFPLEEAESVDNIVLIGGGIGAPPLLALARAVPKEKLTVVLGYRSLSAGLFLKEEFEKVSSKLLIASDDGTAGVKGTVIDALRTSGIKPGLIYSCGPMPMLKAVKELAEENDSKAFISLEERMACGVGACLGCVVKTKTKDEHSQVNNKRICTEGPVFDAEKVVFA